MRRRWAGWARFLWVVCTVCVGGCASGGPGPVDKALEWVGLVRPEVAERARSAREAAQGVALPRRVNLRLHAGGVLNVDSAGRPLAVVARIYKLRSINGFRQLPYEAFLAAEPASDSPLRTEVVSVRELVLAPGQHHEALEVLPSEVSHLAVVALFRAPAPQRWRFVFESGSAADTGVTLGLHGCAMSVGTGEAVEAPIEIRRVAGVRCG